MPDRFALATLFIHVDDLAVQIVEGWPYDEDDPIVRQFPHLFSDVSPVVEQATAAPGEKRATRAR